MTSLIYEPAGRAREYAPLACNIYRGCDHQCLYCFSPMATKRDRAGFALSAVRDGFIAQLTRDAAKLQRAGVTGQVLLSFTCDPYQKLDAVEGITRAAIAVLHSHGFDVCALTKGGSRALRDLDLFTERDAFAATLTFLDDARSLEWEPGAALPSDRIAALQQFHAAGVPTWVSLEPVLDPEAALDIIRATCEFVDLFKVGKLNYHPLSKQMDWTLFAWRAVELLDELGYRRVEDPDQAAALRSDKRYYIKRDLAAFLSERFA